MSAHKSSRRQSHHRVFTPKSLHPSRVSLPRGFPRARLTRTPARSLFPRLWITQTPTVGVVILPIPHPRSDSIHTPTAHPSPTARVRPNTTSTSRRPSTHSSDSTDTSVTSPHGVSDRSVSAKNPRATRHRRRRRRRRARARIARLRASHLSTRTRPHGRRYQRRNDTARRALQSNVVSERTEETETATPGCRDRTAARARVHSFLIRRVCGRGRRCNRLWS